MTAIADTSGHAEASAWAGILDADENILWQGRPDAAITVGPAQIASLVFGLFFAGFALYWMLLAATAGGLFWTFGLIHFTVGIGIMIGPILGPAWKRRHTHYTLTNKRAFIGTALPLRARKLVSHPINPDTKLVYVDSNPASIHFAERPVRSRRRTTMTPVGFERIPDGPKVFALFRDIQNRNRP